CQEGLRPLGFVLFALCFRLLALSFLLLSALCFLLCAFCFFRHLCAPNSTIIMSVKISFPDGHAKEFPAGVTGAEIARSISEGLARNALAVEFNGEVVELSRPIEQDGTVRILTWSDAKGKNTFWHSSA